MKPLLVTSLFLCAAGACLAADAPRTASPAAEAASPQTPEQLIAQLGSQDFQERERASGRLIALGADALAPLRKALDHRDAEVRRRAQHCIGVIEKDLKVAALAARLKDRRAAVRAGAADGLLELGPVARAAVPALAETLADPDGHVRSRVVWALANIGPDAQPAVPKLLDILQDEREDADLRWDVAHCFERIGPGAAPALAVLLRLSKHRRASLRQGAVLALPAVGGGRKEVIAALLRALNDPNLRVQGTAAGGLGDLGKEPDLVIPAIIALIRKYKGYKDEDNDPRDCAIRGLGGFGPKASRAVPALLAVLTDDQEPDMLHRSVLLTLREMGPGAKAAVPALKKILESNPNDLKAEAALQAIEGR